MVFVCWAVEGGVGGVSGGTFGEGWCTEVSTSFLDFDGIWEEREDESAYLRLRGVLTICLKSAA